MSAAVPPISGRAVAAIIGWEVTDKETYLASNARPTWPGDASGVTIGIGYDLGYEDTFRADWQAHLPAADVDRLAEVTGRFGHAAVNVLGRLRDVVIPWDAAIAVFRDATLPRETAKTLAIYPQAGQLSPDSLGALVSLVYNRGPSLAGERRREMAAIRDALAEGRFVDVPQLLRAMKRLWPNTRGLRDRRDGEALLFEAGLPQSLVEIG